jgi:hypothetical protein
VRSLPLIISFLAAAALAPAALHRLSAAPFGRRNYRGRRVAFPLGVVILAASATSLAVCACVSLLPAGTATVAVFVLGVGLLGLADDALAGSARGIRGHLRALLARRFDTAMLKACGTLGLALIVLHASGLRGERLALAGGVLVLAPHAFNLVDLRPGRAIKLFSLLAAILLLATRASRELWLLGPFVGPLAAIAYFDVRERGMLGDSGASLIGALAGLWLVSALPSAALAGALATLAAVAIYGEVSSISALITRAPLLRRLDSMGRPS